MCTFIPPSRRGRSGSIGPCRKANGKAGTGLSWAVFHAIGATLTLRSDAPVSDGGAVGEKMLHRATEAALNRLPAKGGLGASLYAHCTLRIRRTRKAASRRPCQE